MTIESICFHIEDIEIQYIVPIKDNPLKRAYVKIEIWDLFSTWLQVYVDQNNQLRVGHVSMNVDGERVNISEIIDPELLDLLQDMILEEYALVSKGRDNAPRQARN